MINMLKILLIEDNILNRKIVTFFLKDRYNITCAESGREAINLFKTNKFDLIIMDLMMPEMDGYETTQLIRDIETIENKGNFIPIIALTAKVYDNDRDKCLSAGMNEFMVKPFNLNKLEEILKNLNLM